MKSISQIIINALQEIISNPVHDENKIALYFAPTYQQTVDGNQLSYHDFVKHMAVLKACTKHIDISFKSVVAESDTVFTHHYVTIDKIQGEQCKFEVLACFTLSSEKIVRCEELTRMVSGTCDDRDLGSRS